MFDLRQRCQPRAQHGLEHGDVPEDTLAVLGSVRFPTLDQIVRHPSLPLKWASTSALVQWKWPVVLLGITFNSTPLLRR